MGAGTFMDRKEPFVEPSARSPFLNAPSRQLQPAEKRVPKTQQLQPEERSLSDTVTSNTDVTVIQPLILDERIQFSQTSQRVYLSCVFLFPWANSKWKGASLCPTPFKGDFM
ncbi:hypothetical protein DPX16_16573 [Anabarilius grahami]|uniref:Uncharacterized protein n=1 Tax=Anabarilius grahami TaxID=495550 RepID=A0A3N0XV31_ANAGA|nr:hypothetical protein DPX16_16573 [Anabarilius grahami]